MYFQTDLDEVQRQLKKVRLIALIPAVLLLAIGIAIFVVGRLNRSDSAWMLTALFTILGGGCYLFVYGLSIKPAKAYRALIRDMMHGRLRQTEGIFKSFAPETCDREGLPFHALLLNVGDRDDGEDDRLFYWDAQKPMPQAELGSHVRIFSNDNRISRMELL